MRAVPKAVCLLLGFLGVVSPRAAGPPATPAELAATAPAPTLRVPIPFPDLDTLEPAVAAQLRQARGLLDATLKSERAAPGATSESLGELGRLYHAYELEKAAEACYRNARDLSPGDFRWPHYLGYLYETVGRLNEAVESFERALELRPDDLPALVSLAEVHRESNHLEEAEVILARALELSPRSPAALAALGELRLSQRRYDEAAEHLKAALDQQPDANRLHYPLAMAYRALGDADRAREHLARHGPVGIRVRDPLVDGLRDLTRGERVHLLQGRMAYGAGRFAEAAEAFRHAVAAAPDSAGARVNLGSTLMRLGDSRGAVAEYEEALRLAPDNASAHFNLGTLLALAGDFPRAIQEFQAVLEGDPRDHEAHLELADALRSHGSSGEALPHYAEAARLEPNAARAWLGEATLLVDAGRFRAALDRLERGHARLPTDGRLASALAKMLAACPDVSLRDGPRALDLALRVYNAQRTLGHAETVALALAESGRCDDAAKWQRELVAAAADPGGEERLARLRATLRTYEDGPPCSAPGGTGPSSPTPDATQKEARPEPGS